MEDEEKDLWENAPRAWERDDRSHAARLVATFGLSRHLDASALVPMNRNPSLSKVSDASSARLYKMPSRSVIEPEKSGLQRGRGRDGREDLGMPKPNRPAKKPVLRDLSDDSDDELEPPVSFQAPVRHRHVSHSTRSTPARLPTARIHPPSLTNAPPRALDLIYAGSQALAVIRLAYHRLRNLLWETLGREAGAR